MSKIYVSYSRQDLVFTEKLVSAFSEKQIDAWIDWKSIPKGETFQDEIGRAIEESDIFLFIISPDSASSLWCKREIDHAISNGKRIIPVLIRETDAANIHPAISQRNWVFYREGKDSFESLVDEIRRVIETDYEWVKYHAKLQVRALEWERHKDNSRLLRGKELAEAETRLAGIKNIIEPQPTKLQIEFILASRKREGKTRRFIIFGLLASLGIMTVLLLLNLYFYSKLNESLLQDLPLNAILFVGIVISAFGSMAYLYNTVFNRRNATHVAKPESPIMLRVFLCHSSKDKPKVRHYYERLKNEKRIDPWLDVEKLLPGADWDLEIRLAVKSSDVVLVFLSKYSINKEGYVQKEIKQALDVADEKPDGTIFIIPLRLEECDVPDRLKKWQWLNLYGNQEKDVYDKLILSLRKRANDLAEKNTGNK